MCTHTNLASLEAMAATTISIQANNYAAWCLYLDPSLPTTTIPSCPLPHRSPRTSHLPFYSLLPYHRGTDEDKVLHGTWRADMSGRRVVGRVVSDLSHSNYHEAKDRGLHRQDTSSSGSGAGKAAKQRLVLLFSSVVANWARSESNRDDAGSAKSKKQQAKGTGKRRGLEIGLQVVRKYASMLEQLFVASSPSGGSRERERRGPRRTRHSFTSGHLGGSGAASRRHRGRLSSAPASLTGSPANSRRHAVRESVKASTSSEVSTMEELQSAIQAAIAHCKNSIAVATTTHQAAARGDDKQRT